MNALQLQRFRENALHTIRWTPTALVVCGGVYLLSLSYLPQSFAYQFTAVIAGAASFPILWRYWHTPSGIIFGGLIFVLVTVQRIAQDHILQWRYPLPWVWPTLQFLSIYFFVVLFLVFIFRRRMRAFLSDATPYA